VQRKRFLSKSAPNNVATFHWIAVVLSTVLGLGIARILSGYVAAFKSRHRVAFDWLGFVLAGIVLGRQLQFWWALAALNAPRDWSLGSFTLLVAMVILLFLAAALIVPDEPDLAGQRRSFERDGRWAMLMLACYHLACIFANWWFFDHFKPMTTAVLMALAVCAVTIASIPQRNVQSWMATVYVILNVAETLVASARIYPE
jgi:hypothetical protein